MTEPVRGYLSGQISSYPQGVEAARSRFAAAKHRLKLLSPDLEVVNPFEVDTDCDGSCGGEWTGGPNADPHSWQCWMRADLRALLTCQRILMLQGWEYSSGALLEFNTARAVGIDPVFLGAAF